MSPLNRAAMSLPADQLVTALEERIAHKQAVLEERNRQYGRDRIYIGSYMENLGWPELFGYDMNRLFADPAFALEQELRQRIFWLDNSHDDSKSGLWIGATVGMYYDVTLFGQPVTHTPGGVPHFPPHPIGQKPDLKLIPPIDFNTSGVMPDLIRMYEALRKLNDERYGGRLAIQFPTFNRGPLDIYIQLRGYENFVEDTMERPEFARAFLERIVTERIRWNQERQRYLKIPPAADAKIRIDDDWVNIPFISPTMFRELAVPAYRRIAAEEGKVNCFHTCGVMVPVVRELLGVFPDIRNLEISGWNDFGRLDEMLDPGLQFSINFINTFVLSGTEAQHREKLERIAKIRDRRVVWVCAQAMVKLYDTYEENLGRMNRFIDLAREIFRR